MYMIRWKLNVTRLYDLPWNEPHLQMETQKTAPRISSQSPNGSMCMNVGMTMVHVHVRTFHSLLIWEASLSGSMQSNLSGSWRRTFTLSVLLRAVQLNRPETGLLFSSTTYMCMFTLEFLHVDVYNIINLQPTLYLKNVLVR